MNHIEPVNYVPGFRDGECVDIYHAMAYVAAVCSIPREIVSLEHVYLYYFGRISAKDFIDPADLDEVNEFYKGQGHTTRYIDKDKPF